MKRLNTDQEIAPIVAQFVPVKLDISSEEYSQWRMDHPSEGNTIPKLFVVRADGETLYGKSGSLSGNDLPLMLSQALQHSGKILTVKEAKALTKAADEFEQMVESDQIQQAVKALSRIQRIGEPGKIASYSEPAKRVNQLALDTATEIKTQLESLGSKMEGDAEVRLNVILEFLQLKRQYGAMKILKADLAAFQKQYTTKSNSQLTREAKIIDSAKAANSKSKTTRAISRLNDLIEATEIAAVKTAAEKVLQQLQTADEVDIN